MAKDRVLVIGGGHNGLVAAAYLAKAGKDVTLLERSDVVGGILRNSEIAPGFIAPGIAHTVGRLRQSVCRSQGHKERHEQTPDDNNNPGTPSRPARSLLSLSRFHAHCQIVFADFLREPVGFPDSAKTQQSEADAPLRYDGGIRKLRRIQFQQPRHHRPMRLRNGICSRSARGNRLGRPIASRDQIAVQTAEVQRPLHFQPR